LALTDFSQAPRPDLSDHVVSAFSDLELLVRREVELLDQVVPVPCAWVVQRRLLSMSPWRESASSDGRPAVHGALV
jgi:hypothetical protein